jgi:2-keto-4-pentenoate hydratase/2-oxohepta-3-ene-1,7-dioic acid hydratase in catechol pathway
MIFGCAHIVSYVSRFMTLLPGDVICTGTPQGVGMGRGRFLQVRRQAAPRRRRSSASNTRPSSPPDT